jgi:heme exporter protein D
MRNLDFSSWQSVVMTLLGLVMITFVMVGIRLLVMQTVQQRRERENRQINERLRTLIAAYKSLGSSFTGDLAVDPTHLRDLLRRQAAAETAPGAADTTDDNTLGFSERSRRIRDAVEAALSDVILLGTEEQVRLAARAANDLAAGRPTRTDELVISLRNFIRQVLDLEAVPAELTIPRQGPARPGTSSGGGKGKGAEGGERDGTKQGGKLAGGMAGGGGLGLGLGGLALGDDSDDQR